jgi:hypothetical protein
MALKTIALALGSIAAASPGLASAQSDWSKDNAQPAATAPAGDANTRYCMRVEPQTGSRIESIECWTRDEWTAGGVDVDQDWAKEGVRVLNG